jgi:hypothetical protein
VTSTKKLFLNYVKSVAHIFVAAASFFVVCGGMGALFVYWYGPEPFSDSYHLTANIADLKNPHPEQSAYNAFIGVGTFGSVLFTPIFIMLISAALKGKEFPLLLKMTLATAGAVLWGVFVCVMGTMLFARL